MLRVNVAITVIIRFSAWGTLLLVPQGRALIQDRALTQERALTRERELIRDRCLFLFEKQPNVKNKT